MPEVVNFSRSCPFCGQGRTLALDAEAYFNWNKRGFLVQHAFPELSVDDREFLISGICERCWV